MLRCNVTRSCADRSRGRPLSCEPLNTMMIIQSARPDCPLVRPGRHVPAVRRRRRPCRGRRARARESACVGCHEDAAFESPAHPDTQCAECHTNITPEHKDALPAELKMEPDAICGQCHGMAAKQLPKSVHADHTCKKCHGPAHKVDNGVQRRVEDVVGRAGEVLRQVPRRSHRQLREERARQGPAQVGPDRGLAFVQRLPWRAQHRRSTPTARPRRAT